MNNIKIFSPINNIRNIELVAKTKCKNIYIYHSSFLEKGMNDSIGDYANKAKEYGLEFFVNFKNSIREIELSEINNLLQYLISCPISGILVNSLDVLELIKNSRLPFKVFIDSGLNIHNLSGVEFVNLFYPIENINITDEIYVKNLVKINKYSKLNLSIDTNNLTSIAEQVFKDKTIDAVLIKGDFQSSEELLKGIQLVERIIKNPKSFKDQKLPFKDPENLHYKSNHFLGEFWSPKGKDFKFSGNVKPFDWKFKRSKLSKKLNNFEINKIPKLSLKLTSLEQINYLKKYINKLKFNPVASIEYGEIINTADLAKYSFDKIIGKVKKDCYQYGMNLQLSTPRILNERDFDRVYDYVKLLCIKEPYPSALVINNIGYWEAIINDTDFDKIPLELGQGLNLINSTSILCLAHQHNIESIDFSNFVNIKDIELCISKIKDIAKNKKLIIAGSIRIPSLGLCPLNNDPAILSRLSCSAPCHNGNYSIYDPINTEVFPIAVDGFCRMHLFKDKSLDLFKYISFLQKIGINEFVIDFNGMPANAIPILLNKFLNSLDYNEEYFPDPNFITNLYELEACCEYESAK